MVSAFHYPLYLTLYNHFSKKDTFPSLTPTPFDASQAIITCLVQPSGAWT